MKISAAAAIPQKTLTMQDLTPGTLFHVRSHFESARCSGGKDQPWVYLKLHDGSAICLSDNFRRVDNNMCNAQLEVVVSTTSYHISN